MYTLFMLLFQTKVSGLKELYLLWNTGYWLIFVICPPVIINPLRIVGVWCRRDMKWIILLTLLIKIVLHNLHRQSYSIIKTLSHLKRFFLFRYETGIKHVLYSFFKLFSSTFTSAPLSNHWCIDHIIYSFYPYLIPFSNSLKDIIAKLSKFI